MKNKLSTLFIAVALSCDFASVAYAASIESDEDTVSMELSENEVKAIQEECTEIGVENDMQGSDLTTYVAECFAANTMVMDEFNAENEELASENQDMTALDDEGMTDTGDAELVTEDQDIPVLEDEPIIDTEEPEVEEASTESMS